jgi:hypothetical protein
MAKAFLVGFCALVGASGCAVTFNDSAPATTPGSRYVVGSKANDPVVFLCPEKPGAECELVDVEIK